MPDTGQDDIELRGRSVDRMMVKSSFSGPLSSHPGQYHAVSSRASPSSSHVAIRKAISDEDTHSTSRAKLIRSPSSPPRSPNRDGNQESPDSRRSLSSFIFVILTIATFTIVVINFLQAGLLDHIHSGLWINIPPAIVLAIAGSIITFYLVRRRRWKTAQETWRKEDWAYRVSWIGQFLSILLPLIACQFVYMNLWALPEHRSTVWTTSLNYQDPIMPPALLIVHFNQDSPSWADQAVFPGKSQGACSKYTEEDRAISCAKNMQWSETAVQMGGSTIQYHVFNPLTPKLTLHPSESISISFPTTWNSSGYLEPYLYFAFFDSALIPDLADIIGYVGYTGCTLFNGQPVPVLGTNYFGVEPFEIQDNVGVLNESTTRCSASKRSYSHYSTYRTTLDHINWLDASLCNVANSDDYEGPCTALHRISFSTNMVTRQVSDHGTSFKQIVIDEGSIVGGVMFFTWFLGLYVL